MNNSRKTPQYAIIKFNNGMGALLCNHCSVIIATGVNHPDRNHLCDKCIQEPLLVKKYLTSTPI